MTRKKSRPTHRENAAAVPSNEGGFYKMFWNSMDTNPGTNGPNSPSQGDAPLTSSPVIVINDSEDSPCGQDENSCENLAVPLPIKEEARDDATMSSNQHSFAETSSNSQEYHSGISGDCSSHQTCLPTDTSTSPSKNSSLSPSPHDHLNSPEKTPQTCEHSAAVYSCIDSTVPGTSSQVPPTEISVTADQPMKTPHRAEEDGEQMELAEDTQVCEVNTERWVETFPENNFSMIANCSDVSEAFADSNNVISNQSHRVDSSDSTPVDNDEISHAPPVHEGILAEAGAHSYGISQEPDVPISNLQNREGISARSDISDALPIINAETLHEIPVTARMELESQPQSPAVGQENYEQTPHELPALSLLRSLLNAPDEDLEDLNLAEALAELPGLIDEHNDLSDQDSQNDGEMVCFGSVQESSCMPIDADVSNMAVDQNTTLPAKILPTNENNMNPDVSLQKQTNEKTVDENDEFPTYNNFLPKKIKLDTIGILRSVKVLKDSVRSLYKEYLKDDVILRTVGTSEPLSKDNESSEDIEETPSFPPISVYPICCVKMERLPDPFVKKNTVAMSDYTFKTWKRQIIRQRNEEKFRHLKVWRRGRTLLWRECELAGMDRTTYDEQVAYVNKHKLSENSSSDSDPSDDEHGASSHEFDSSEESYSDLENEDSEGELSSLPSLSSPTKQISSESHSMNSSCVTSETTTDTRLLENEYVVERTNQSSEAKAPSALKITIRKTSTTRSEDDKEKPAEEEESFPVPAHPNNKSRKIATKRTYRRPSDPIPKASLPPKPTAADTKKSKNTPLDEYDQSLLGTRSYEVENFNLLEKWDIPFEEPTLFRSPRAASKLAQLKTKEAFLPLKRHAPPKPAANTTSVTPITTTSTDFTTLTVSKAVKDVVEMLCSKTVEAILFPESQSSGATKAARTNINLVDAEDSSIRVQSSKSLVPSEETTSNLDESSEFSQSESNCTLDASSDFSGSTASLVSEDLPPPKNKSPQKPRRRRPRFGPAWGKKKKVKSKLTIDKPVEKESREEDKNSFEDNDDSPIHSTEQLVTGKVTQGSVKLIQEVAASPVHSTQVPVVSEGPGQSPYESEDDSAHRLKDLVSQNDSHRTVNKATKETLPKDVIRSGETPTEPIKKVQEDVVPPRLTRSKQPTVELDPDLLENFGTRKRRSRAEVTGDLQGQDGKKVKQEVTKKSPMSKVRTFQPGTMVLKETRSTPGKVVSDDLNTQVPEVSSSEGPGDVGLDHENKHNQLNKVETGEPTVRILRSQSRGPGPRPTKTDISPIKSSTDDNQKTDEPSQVEESKRANSSQSEKPLVLESPASPPPETVEPEPLTNNRITRSKRRSGPAYVAVKATVDTTLPSVCDIVDSIAGHRLPTPSKLFAALTPVNSSPTTEPITALTVETKNVDYTTIIYGKAKGSSSRELEQEPEVVQTDRSDGKSILPPPATTEVTGQGSTLEKTADSHSSSIAPVSNLSESESSSMAPVPKSTTETPADISVQSSQLSNNVKGADIPCLQTEKSQSAAAVLGTVAVEKDVRSGTASASGSLAVEQHVTENVECGRLEVLDTLNTILAVTSPKKVRYPVSTTSPLLPPPLGSSNLQTTAPTNTSVSQLSSSALTPAANSSLPGFLSSNQDINNIPCLPGTFLSSFLNTTLDANLTAYSNEMNDSTALVDDPDGDLVIDEGDVNFDVNFFENLTNADLDKNDNNADFSDEDNNTDLADKIDKIVKDQIHQDPVSLPSLKSKETGSGDGNKKVTEETSPSKSVLNRRDSIDDRTGLPTNLIQRLRDPRIRSRLLSQLEEEEATGKTQTALAPLLNTVPTNNVTPSMVRVPQAGEIANSDPQRKTEVVVVVSSSSRMSLQAPTVSQVITQPVMGGHFKTVSSAMPGQPTPVVLPKTPALATPRTLGKQSSAPQDMPVVPADDTEKPEEPPDPSKVDFVVPPSDDEDEEDSIKCRPKKAKKQLDVELMYKSPLEDLQSEARPGYGERAPRRYADNYPRRKSGDDRSRWDDRRSKDDQRWDDRRSKDDQRWDDRRSKDDKRFEDRGRSQSRDRRFSDRARSCSRDGQFGRSRSRSRDGRFDDRRRDRSRSRDHRAFYDRSPRDQSRDRRAYDPYTQRENPETAPHNMEMQVPYNQSPWTASPAFHHHQMVMQSPRWQPNYYPEPHVPHPPIFVPEPPKIDFMETRLINLELLPKTTNLEIPPIKKVFTYFDKGCNQVMDIPPPTYDPKEEPRPIRMMDPVSEEMVEFVQNPRPTSGLTKEIFRSFPLDLNLDEAIKFYFISPSFIMVQDNEEDLLSSSDEEEEQLPSEETLSQYHQQQDKAHQQKKRVGTHVLEHQQKQLPKHVDSHLQKQGGEHHSKGENEFIPGNCLNKENPPNAMREDTPLQNILQNLPLLQQFSNMQQFQPPIPPPPPAPEWNDVDLRISQELAMEERSRSKGLQSPSRSPRSTTHRSRSNSPKSISRHSRSNSPKSTSRRPRSKSPRSASRRSRSKSPRSTSRRSRSKSPRSTSRRSQSNSPKSTSRRSRSNSPKSTNHRSRSKSPRSTSRRSRSNSPRSASRRSRRSPASWRHRSRSCSIPRSDTSISPSRSPSYSRRGSRRRRSRSRSSERPRSSRSRRSRSPIRHSTSISPSRKRRR